MAISIHLIRTSFEHLRTKSTAIAERVEQSLSQANPPLENGVQKESLLSQRSAMISSFIAIIANLDRPEPLTKYLLGLGERYSQLGLQGFHYDVFSQALIKAFSEEASGTWNSEIENEWKQVLSIITEALKAGGGSSMTSTAPIQQPHIATNASLELSENVKLHIQKTVNDTVQQLISAEVRRCFEEQMRKIEKMKSEDLLKLAG